MKIESNKVRCETCLDTIESCHDIHQISCRCGNITINGGKTALKRIVRDERGGYVELSKFEYENQNDVEFM